ncbi:MAG TPA: demethylmenaquinone methyltransferase [Streptosporangiaceae bacterium]|nr:demethylmenaquinone methyltransferase [Streptosporangiaceae bacterium]
MTRAQLDKQPGDVAAMFDAVAERYDLLNDVLSLGQDRWWRSIVARLVAAKADDLVLDIAAGTGTSSRAFTKAGARCVACDFSLGMLRAGARKPGERVTFAAGDALSLPFAEQTFDVVTISFGLRNVTDPDAALTEMLRVTKPGGRLVICEFSHLPARPLDVAYQRYLATALPTVAKRISANPGAYEYLAESIKDWPPQAELADRIEAAGWSKADWRNLTGGIVSLHVARRPR